MMMRRLRYGGVAVVLVWAALLASALAQDSTELNLSTAYDKAVSAIDNGKFDEGIATIDGVISAYGSSGLENYGPVFGHFYYIKGILHIRKNDFEGAIAPLKTCYEKYNNETLKKADAATDAPKLPNRFWNHALIQWAGCLLAQQKFDEGAKLYETALANESIKASEPAVTILEVQINLAKCYLNGSQLQKGYDFLVSLLRRDTLTDPTKRMIFMLLANNWSPKVEYVPVRNFLKEFGELLRGEDLVSRHDRNPAIFALAGDGFEKNDPIRALKWYEMLAHPGAVMEVYRKRVEDLKSREVPEEPKELREQVAAQIAQLEKNLTDLNTEYASMMMGIGAAHYQLQSLSGSREAYRVMADNFPKHKERPVILHNLVVCCVNLGRWKEAYKYGIIFFKEFPDHELKPGIARVLVEVIFLQGEYQEAYDVASDVREDMAVGSDIRDVPDFVVAGSLYHLGRFEEAEIETADYLTNYPNGQRLEHIKFYYGATKVNLFKWTESAAALDEFLEQFPGSSMRPTALYLSGLSHLVLENWDNTLKWVNELHDDWPNADELAASWNVKGDALVGKGGSSFEEVSACFLEAKRLVEEEGRGDSQVAGYALRQLIMESGQAEEWELAGKYFDDFQAKYQDTVWRLDAIVGALTPLVKLDRREEARDLVEVVVNEVGNEAGDPQLDDMVGSYIDFLDENYEIEEVLVRLRNFPANPSPPPAPLRAWLAMGEIELLGKADPNKYKKEITEAYYRLQALHDGGNLSNYTMVRLARWNLEVRDQPDAAREIYDFILKERPQGEAVGFALVDTGKILAKEGNGEEAKRRFERVLNESDRPDLREEATLGIARLMTAEKKYADAQSWWEKYMENREWAQARPEANFSYALCIDQQGKKAEAMKAYVNVYANFAGHLDWSTKAYLRAAALRREEGDKLASLKILQDMLKRMGHLEHPGIDKGRELFNQWRDEFVAAGGSAAVGN